MLSKTTLLRSFGISLGSFLLLVLCAPNGLNAQKVHADSVHAGWPDLIYASNWGGSLDDESENMIIDDQGNIIIAGQTKSPDLPITAGAFQTTHGGKRDIFVAKFAADNSLMWATYIGGDSSEYAYGLAVDNDGNIYVSGRTASFDFPVLNAFQNTLNDGDDGVVMKFGPSGTLLWSTYFGGEDDDDINGIAVDDEGRVYITGETESADLYTSPGASQTLLIGWKMCFITRFSPSGDVIWSTYYGGSDEENGNDIIVDGDQNVIVIGEAYSVDCPLSTGFFQDSIAGNDDALLIKLDSLGTIIFATVVGGSDDDDGRKVGVDPDNNIYIIGDQLSTDLPTTTGAFQSTQSGGWDAFVMKFESNGQLIWSTYLGGSGDEYVYGIDVDHAGTVYVYGQTDSTDFPVTTEAYQDSLSVPDDMFISTFDSVGNIIWSTYFGGNDDDDAAELRFVGHKLYIVGTAESTDMPITADALQSINAGDEDVYLAIFEYAVTATGIQLIEQSRLSIFPLPAKENLTIQFEDGKKRKDLQFDIYSSTGALVLSQKAIGQGSRFTISTRALSSGMYFLEVLTDGVRIASEPLVIE